MMKTGTLILYHANHLERKVREKLRRELMGYRDGSNMGRYVYERKGLLKDIPFIKPCKSVVIVRDKDAKRLINLFDEFGVKLFSRKVILTEDDLRTL